MESENESKYLVFLYRREKTTINDEILKDQIDISYEFNPLEIVLGKIVIENNKQVFISDDNKYKLHLIDDMDAQSEEFVYAFPLDVTTYTEEDIDEYTKYLKNEEKLFSLNLYQIYTEHSKTDGLYTFTYDDEKNIYLLNPNKYDVSSATVYADLQLKDYKRKNNIKKRLIVNANDIQEEEEEKEENEKGKIESVSHKAVKLPDSKIYADELYDEIRKYVVCQDEQIKTISTIFAKNQRIDNPYMKTNFIVCGPTGVGKSEIFRILSNIAKVPMVTEDANEFTAAGYVGRTVTDMLYDLYNAAEGDIQRAENGIIVIDEIDKKAGGAGDLDVTKRAVIQSLLKMFEGHTYEINVGKKTIYFDTSRVTFVGNGAFSGIEKYAKKKSGMGFGSDISNELTSAELYNYETITKYGLLPEFVGRNFIIPMNSLNVENFETILKNSKLSYLKLYAEYLKNLNIQFKYSNAVIKAIANKAEELKIGARSLKSITEKALQVADFYIGGSNASSYKVLKITPKTIEDNRKFILR